MKEISNLLKIAPPPTDISEKPSDDWSKFEHNAGFKFPIFYKEFIKNYGTVKLDNFVIFFNPFSENNSININMDKSSRHAYGVLKAQFPNYFKRSSSGSFFTFAITDNGDSFFWDLDDELNVGVHDGSSESEELTNLKTDEFFIELICNRMCLSVFPEDLAQTNPRFSPII